MSINSLAAAAVVLALSGAVGARAAAAPQEKPADVSGAWRLTVETGQGAGTPSVTFKQDGEALTGTYSSQFFGKQPVKGMREGNAIPVTFTGRAGTR